MGGVQVIPLPKPSDAEIRARLIQLGKVKLRDPHTVWVVEDPPATGLWAYHDRTHLDNICYATPVEHLEIFRWSVVKMTQSNTTFYPYKYKQEAIADAQRRLAQKSRDTRGESRAEISQEEGDPNQEISAQG